MNIDALQTRFETVAHANNRAALSKEQFQILIEGEGATLLAWLAGMVEAAAKGRPESIEIFKKVHTAVRITDSFRTHGFPETSKSTVMALLDEHGANRVVNATRALIEGDNNARHEIRGWIQAAKPAAQQGHAPAQTGGAQRQSSAPAAGADPDFARRFGQCPPPPGVRTSQVRQDPNHGEGANVHQLRPQQSARTRDDDRTQTSRPAPQQASRPTPEPEAPHHHRDAYRPQGSAAGGNQERQYDQHACFGKDVAVQFQNCPTKDRTHNTVMLKIARAKGGTCKQGVDWDNAILINLEPHEVQTCTAVLLGIGTKVRYAGHGPTNDKWFELSETTEEWAGAIRLQVGQGDEKRSVNIGPTDVGEVCALFLRALGTQMRVAPAVYPMILRRAYDLYQKNAQRMEARRNQNGGGQRRSAHG